MAVMPEGHPQRRASLPRQLTWVHSAMHPMAADTRRVGDDVLKDLLEAHKVRCEGSARRGVCGQAICR